MNNTYYTTGMPESAETFPQFIRDVAAAYGDQVAVSIQVDGQAEYALTYTELERQSAELARGLIARGVGKGSRVGFICGNGPDFVLMFAAIARAGGIAIPVSTFIKSNELVRVLRQSDVQGLIVQRRLLGKDYVERLSEALPELAGQSEGEVFLPQVPYLRWVVSTGEDLPAAVHTLDGLKAGGEQVSEDLLLQVEAEVHATDQLMEIYTSGSMALPKGVKHSHGATLFRTHYLTPMVSTERGARVPVPMPMFWVGGLMMYLLPNLQVGATTLCTEGTWTSSQMAMGTVMADDDLQAMPLPKTIWALGMTETLGPYSYADELRVPGYPLCAPLDHIADRYEVRVADENGAPVADGEVGEIQVRGFALTAGLHKVARSDYFTDDGFLHTGDMGRRDGARVLFVGRNGDMIKTASSNVSPAEVELEMQQLEGVHSAYVVGIPDAERGQLVVAAVVPREGATLDFDRLQEELKGRLSSFKVPRAYVQISREEVPMLPSNKVARRQIERMMIDKLGRG